MVFLSAQISISISFKVYMHHASDTPNTWNRAFRWFVVVFCLLLNGLSVIKRSCLKKDILAYKYGGSCFLVG